jgi:hypothetical protein
VGSWLGGAVFGGIANATLGGQATRAGDRPAAGPLTAAVHHVFVGVLATAAVVVVGVRAMPGRTAGASGAEPSPEDLATAQA